MILLISPKDKYATNRLLEEASKLSIPVECLSVQELAARNFKVDVSLYGALYARQVYPYFSEIISLARSFKSAGKFVVDEQELIGNFETSKWDMYEKLATASIPIPNTEQLQKSNPPACGQNLKSKPFILKRIYGFGGNEVFLVHNEKELQKISSQHPRKEWLVQEYIAADWEYKVITIGFQSLPAVLRFKISDSGYKIDENKYEIHPTTQFPKVAMLAEQAPRVLGRELAKVDILEKDGKLFVLEVNRSPSLLPFEPYSRLNVAGMMLEYIRNRM